MHKLAQKQPFYLWKWIHSLPDEKELIYKQIPKSTLNKRLNNPQTFKLGELEKLADHWRVKVSTLLLQVDQNCKEID